MSKTPYEIRLELLKLANDILTAPVHNRREALMNEYHSKLTDENRNDLAFPTLPEFPTTETVISEAERLNKFICQN